MGKQTAQAKEVYSHFSLRRRANARNVSFRISLRWPIHIINPVDETKLSCYTSHRRSTTVSLETYPSIHIINPVDKTKLRCFIKWQSKSERSDCFFLGRDFAIRTVSISCVFFVFESRQIQNKHGPNAI